MKNIISRLKRKFFTKAIDPIKDTMNAYIQPFMQKPSSNLFGIGSVDNTNEESINAHELFSHYTADIIKEEIVFTR